MEYRIEIPKRVQKELERLPRKFQERIVAKLYMLAADPSLGKRLQGEFEGLYTVRFWPYRIVYEIKRKELVVLVLKVAHRKSVYR